MSIGLLLLSLLYVAVALINALHGMEQSNLSPLTSLRRGFLWGPCLALVTVRGAVGGLLDLLIADGEVRGFKL